MTEKERRQRGGTGEEKRIRGREREMRNKIKRRQRGEKI